MKKIISIVLCVFVVLCMFVGCSAGEENNNDTADSKITYTIDAHNSYINQSAVRAYETLCSAVVNGESEALFNTALLDDVNRLFYSDFPLSCLVSRLDFNDNNSGVSITYANGAEEHLKAVDAFNQKVSEILASCGYGKVNNNTLIVNLYSYITKNTEITSKCNYSYDVIMNSKGYSFSFANALSYLLNQAGIKASIVNSTNENGICHMVETEFKGSKYIFIPFYEAKDNGGEALSSFALDYSEIAALGFTDVKYSNGDGVVFDDADVKFSEFRNSVSYSVENNDLSVTEINGEIVQIAL